MTSTLVLSPTELVRHPLTTDMRPGLTLLLEAHRCARDLGQDLWDFSIPVHSLHDAGLNENRLRWLLCQDCLQHALETTRPRAPHRRFRPAPNLQLRPTSCFTLTDRGLHLARALLCESVTSPPVPTAKPHWRADLQELHFGPHLIKKFRRPAANQTTILTAFEEDGWPARIDNPLSPTRDNNDAERLQEAIRRLNHCQQTPLLRFHGDGSGEGVTWEIAR